MMFQPALIIIIIVIVVGVVAKIVNNLNEMNAMKAKPTSRAASSGASEGGGSVRQTKSDMDRFLAEIDRLRKKSADAPSPPPKKALPVASVVQPEKRSEKKAERPRARVVAELADRDRPDTGFAQNIPTATTGPKPGDLPVATVVSIPSGTGAPATKVTKILGRPRPVAKTPFAKTLTGLLNSGQGLALAIVLQEILGPPRCKKGNEI
jgi:hypothetical protein